MGDLPDIILLIKTKSVDMFQFMGSSKADLICLNLDDDFVNGKGGKNNLSGSFGNNTLNGGKGSDQFFLFTGFSIIEDFQDNQDRLVVSLGFDDIDIVQLGNSTVIIDTTSNVSIAELENFNASNLTQADFDFV